MNRRWKYLCAFFAAYGPLLLYVIMIALIKFFPISLTSSQWLSGIASFFMILGAAAAWVGIALLSIPEAFRQADETPTGMDEDEVKEYVGLKKDTALSMMKNLRQKARQR